MTKTRAYKERKKKLKKNFYNVSKVRLMEVCPVPHKLAFITSEDAQRALLSNWKRARSGRRLEIRFYYCKCRTYHLTSKPLRS